jgi:hypothetical protein
MGSALSNCCCPETEEDSTGGGGGDAYGVVNVSDHAPLISNERGDSMAVHGYFGDGSGGSAAVGSYGDRHGGRGQVQPDLLNATGGALASPGPGRAPPVVNRAQDLLNNILDDCGTQMIDCTTGIVVMDASQMSRNDGGPVVASGAANDGILQRELEERSAAYGKRLNGQTTALVKQLMKKVGSEPHLATSPGAPAVFNEGDVALASQAAERVRDSLRGKQ